MPDTTPLYAYKMMCILQLTSILVWSQNLAFLVASANMVVFLALSGGFVPFPYIEDWFVWLQWQVNHLVPYISDKDHCIIICLSHMDFVFVFSFTKKYRISPIKCTFQGIVWALLSNTPTEALLESMELDTPPNVTYNIIINIGFIVIIAGYSVFALSRQRGVR